MSRILSWLAGRSTTPTTLHTPRPNLLPCPGGRPALRARGLAHGFGEGEARTTVLRHVDLDLRRGELALIMGPSGSGKSTLLAALSGLMRPEAGQVLALGKDLWALSRKEQEAFRLRHFGFVFQGYNLFPALTARQQLEIILLWGHGASGREARQRADDTLARLGLAGKGHLRPAQLSGGEKQRVAIGRALVKDPDFCFADEPTNALDWSHCEQVVQMLREAARERRAMVLVVTHDARLVPYADRVFHLDDGRLSEPDEDALSARHAPREGHPYSENAVEEYTRALRRDRRNAELYRKRALAYAAWEKAERALADLNRAESASAGEGWLTLSPVP